MEPPTRILDPDARPNKAPLSFPNGTLKKHQLPRPPPPPPPPPQAADLLYRECLKNHAASLGGHALDGCGEFMPSPSANPADPTSIKCAACGCHRNFHRRLPEPHHHHHHQGEDDEQEGEDEMDGGEHIDNDDGGGDGGGDGEHRRTSSSPPPYFSSAPHMLLALSTGLPGAPGPSPARPPAPAMGLGTAVGHSPAAAVLPRKRFRSKFSPEQKGRMQELSERLGWRMQKRDEGLVEECCREIGVGKGVFKVWMHNNKHNFVPGSSRRGEVGSSSSSGAVGINCDGVGVAVGSAGGGGLEASGNGNGNGSGGAGNTHAVNGSSSSS